MLRHQAKRSGKVCGLAGRWASRAALLFGIAALAPPAGAQVSPRAPSSRAVGTPSPRATSPRATSTRATSASAPSGQSPPSKASCAQAYESAQESRASGALQQTRSRLAYCAQAECPAFVQKDCATWLEEVDRELPSIIISIVGLDASNPALALKLDGQPIADALSGKPLTLDPGQHQLVLERDGDTLLTRTLLAQQGVQNRVLELRLDAAGPSAAPADVTFDADAPVPSNSEPLRSLAFVSWGVGAVGLGAFAVLGTLARADEKRFREDCALVAPTPDLVAPGICLQSTADRRKEKYEREEVLADVGLITGLAGAAVGTVMFVLSTSGGSSDDEPQSARVELSPLPGGAWAGVAGAF